MDIPLLLSRILIFCLSIFLIYIIYINPKILRGMGGRNKGRLLLLITIFLSFSIAPIGLAIETTMPIILVTYLVLFGIIKIVELRR